jgi:hypothetical protein
MYTNISKDEVSKIIQSALCKQEISPDIREQIRSLVGVCIGQNYFQHDNIFFTQTQGLARGAPTSHLFSEIYLQFLDHNMIYKILIE